MTSITVVDSDMSKEEAENMIEAILDLTGWYSADYALVNNKRVWQIGEKTLAQTLGYTYKTELIKFGCVKGRERLDARCLRFPTIGGEGSAEVLPSPSQEPKEETERRVK